MPDKLSADNASMSGDDLKALDDSAIDTYIATDKGEKKNKAALEATERKLVKADFENDEVTDTFTCPGQQKLGVVSREKDGSRTYQGDIEICHDCPYKNRCCQSTKGDALILNTDDKEPLRQQMNSKMEQEKSRAIYKQCKVIVEPVFGQIKNTRFRGFSLRQITAGLHWRKQHVTLICFWHDFEWCLQQLS